MVFVTDSVGEGMAEAERSSLSLEAWLMIGLLVSVVLSTVVIAVVSARVDEKPRRQSAKLDFHVWIESHSGACYAPPSRLGHLSIRLGVCLQSARCQYLGDYGAK